MNNPYTITGTNAKETQSFLLSLDNRTSKSILSNIARHYGISVKEAYEEVTHPEAESLLDYVTIDRSTVSLFFRMWKSKNRA